MVSRSEAIHLIDPFLTADEIGDASVRTPDRDSELRIADRNLTWCQLDANDHMTSFVGYFQIFIQVELEGWRYRIFLVVLVPPDAVGFCAIFARDPCIYT
jgi:hypothetical protein